MEMTLNSKKYGVIKFLIDSEDESLVNSLKLCVSNTRTGMYIMTTDRKYLHRIITKCPKGLVVDHINRNTLDNRKCNLRCVPIRDNVLNSRRIAEDRLKLKEFQVREILLNNKDSNNTLAKKYGVSNCLIAKIRTGEMYSTYCTDLPRRKSNKLNIRSKEEMKIIKAEVFANSGSFIPLSKKWGIPTSVLYSIRKGKKWKNI